MRSHADQHIRQSSMRSGPFPNRKVFLCRYRWLTRPDRSSHDRTGKDSGGVRPIVTLLIAKQRIPLAVPFEALVIMSDLRFEPGVAQEPQIAGADQLIIGAARGMRDVDKASQVDSFGQLARRAL